MNEFLLKNKTLIFVVIITLLGLFFYSYRLRETQLFRDDTARDTLKVLRIWQNKELTLIGPPISFTQQTIREVYLGSLYLYIGLIGLILANWDAVGAVLPNIFFFILSIPFFYLMILKLSNSFMMAAITTTLYTLSPTTVTHARFFWNPNLIIPFSVFFWYLVLKNSNNKVNTLLNYFFAGLIIGLIFNFHYLAALPLIVYAVTLFFGKYFTKGFSILIGAVVGSLPIIIFETRNNFYLTQALFHNLFNGSGPDNFNLIEGIHNFFNIFWSIFGLRSSEIDFPTPFNKNIFNNELLLIITLILIVIFAIRRIKRDKVNILFWPMIVTAVLQTIYFSSGYPIRLRYLFSVYPILIWLIVNFIWSSRERLIILLLLISSIATSITIITNKPSLEKNFIKLSLMEDICKEIVKDSPEGNYNITENLKGDARAMSFRYCLTKDAKVKPQDEYNYNNLTTLYVVSPSIDKIYKDNRWEFYASEPWELEKTKDFGDVKLFKFVKK